MHKVITEELARIEAQHSIKVLYACESGSRAWGFPSRDSDYDVRFLFIYPLEQYLSLEYPADVIESEPAPLLNFVGWEMKKALKLFHKSNPPLLEWLQSPIVYLDQFDVIRQILCMVVGATIVDRVNRAGTEGVPIHHDSNLESRLHHNGCGTSLESSPDSKGMRYYRGDKWEFR